MTVAASGQVASRRLSSPPHVSFIVPTLNRGRYVVRAVKSCLRAQAGTTSVTVEVIVIDSQSDDGSWELLLEHFGLDARVRLVQNQRGLGPTRSWLDGARLAKGEFVTFVWSDDYISSRFLDVLLPLLQEWTELAVGSGIVRQLDNESDLPNEPGLTDVEREAFLLGYFSRAKETVRPPVSPICAVFKRCCFDRWIAVVEQWCTATPLRKQIMWQRAIGPDLLLYLIAANMSTKIPMLRQGVAQFSFHKGSITVSSSRWLLRVGYWLARLWLIECGLVEWPVSSRATAEMAATALLQGLQLAITGPKCLPGMESLGGTKRAVMAETVQIWRTVRTRTAIPAVTLASAVFRVFVSHVKSIYNR